MSRARPRAGPQSKNRAVRRAWSGTVRTKRCKGERCPKKQSRDGHCRAGHADQCRGRDRCPWRHLPPGPAQRPVPDDGELPSWRGCPRRRGHRPGAGGPATPGSGAARHRGTGRRTAPAPPLIASNSRRSWTPARCQRGTSARILPDEFEANAESTKDPGPLLINDRGEVSDEPYPHRTAEGPERTPAARAFSPDPPDPDIARAQALAQAARSGTVPGNDGLGRLRLRRLSGR